MLDDGPRGMLAPPSLASSRTPSHFVRPSGLSRGCRATQGARIFYEETGTGTPILFMALHHLERARLSAGRLPRDATLLWPGLLQWRWTAGFRGRRCVTADVQRLSLSLPGDEFSSQIYVLNAVLLVYMLGDPVKPKFRDQRERWTVTWRD
jgi:hypothetical protein